MKQEYHSNAVTNVDEIFFIENYTWTNEKNFIGNPHPPFFAKEILI